MQIAMPFARRLAAACAVSIAVAATTSAAQEVDPVGLTPTPPPPAGMAYIADLQHRTASHACGVGEPNCALGAAAIPAGIARAPANITATTRVLLRRETAIVYVPEVAGAVDYRAYVVTPGVTFENGDPRGAVLSCAGYRQHPRLLRRSAGVIQLEVVRQFEVTGFTPGVHTLVVEALDRPCPFTGVPGHRDGTIPVNLTEVQGKPWTGPTFPVVSFASQRAAAGNEILNGQGAATTYDITLTPTARRGQPVPYVQPRILARALLTVTSPAGDEAANAPLNDLASPAHAGVFDDFGGEEIIKLSRSLTLSRGGDQHWLEGMDAAKKWFFIVNRAQKGVGDTNDDNVGSGITGAQVWKRHGRLHTMTTDYAQEVMNAIAITSLAEPTRPVDPEKYLRSSFRVDGNGTSRRYWHWMLCGSHTDANLVRQTGDPIPLSRYNLNAFFYTNSSGSPDSVAPDLSAYPGVGSDAVNPTVRLGEFSSTPGDAFDPYAPGPENNLECLQITSFDGLYQPAFVGGQNRWYESGLRAVINPAGKPIGIHSLTSERFAGGPFVSAVPSHYYGASPAAPLIDNFLLPSVPPHWDIYVRRDRVVVYVNGRLGVCWNLDRPLDMTRAKVVYEQVFYHSHGEHDEIHYGINGYQQPTGQFHYIMNTPAADYRTWDFIGESHGVAVPDPLPGRGTGEGGFEESRCERPAANNWRFPPEPPAPPPMVMATPGNGQALITFAPSPVSGGTPVTGYTVTCNGVTASGAASPINVAGLANGVAHACRVAAVNAAGTGPQSAAVNVTPTAAAALALVGAELRKTHAAAGAVSLPVAIGAPVAGAVTVEPRMAPHVLTFLFNNAVTAAGTATVSPAGTASIAGSAGNEVSVALAGIPDRQRVTVTLTGVNGVLDTSVALGFLVGDLTGNRVVNAADIAAAKSRQGTAFAAAKASGDVDRSGTLTAADTAEVRGNAARVLPAP